MECADDQFHHDEDAQKDEDRRDRLNFLRKVYGILSVQLTLTACLVTAVHWIPSLNEGVRHWYLLTIFACIVQLVISCMLMCCHSIARAVPLNYILLTVFTVCEAYLVAGICVYYTANSVIAAAGMTAGLTIVLTGYALWTKRDFTVFGEVICVVGFAIMCLILVSLTMDFPAWWHPVLSAVMIIFFGFFLIYDTQQLAGGHKYSIDLEDYILGAMLIYIDIVMIFVELLKLFGDRN